MLGIVVVALLVGLLAWRRHRLGRATLIRGDAYRKQDPAPHLVYPDVTKASAPPEVALAASTVEVDVSDVTSGPGAPRTSVQ